MTRRSGRAFLACLGRFYCYRDFSFRAQRVGTVSQGDKKHRPSSFHHLLYSLQHIHFCHLIFSPSNSRASCFFNHVSATSAAALPRDGTRLPAKIVAVFSFLGISHCPIEQHRLLVSSTDPTSNSSTASLTLPFFHLSSTFLSSALQKQNFAMSAFAAVSALLVSLAGIMAQTASTSVASSVLTQTAPTGPSGFSIP